MNLLRISLVASTVVWLVVCSTLLAAGVLEVMNPGDTRYENGALVFYLGIRSVGFPLGTAAFYVVYAVVSSALPDLTKMLVYWAVVVAVGGAQWLLLVFAVARWVDRWRKGTQ